MKQPVKTFMKLELKKNRIINVLTVTLAMAVISPAALAAKVASVSPETFAQYGKENAFWEISVRCEGIEPERIIQRKTDGDDWCPKGADNLCGPDKAQAAINACDEEYASTIEQDTRAKEQEQKAQIERSKAQQDELRRQQAAAKPKPQVKPRPSISATISANEAKLRNKISIQEDRIKLDQAKLELRRKELVLERRSIEIEEILETLE